MVYNYDPQTDKLQVSSIRRSKGCTPLMHAILQDNEELVKEILKNDPNTVNAKNELGWTALHIVAMNSRVWNLFKYLRFLLDNNANPNIQDNNGYTTLMMAAINLRTDSSEETMRMLLEYKADPNIQDNTGCTVLIIIARYLKYDSIEEIVRILLEYGADPKIKDNNGEDVVKETKFYFLEKRIKELEHKLELRNLEPIPGINFINTFMEEFGEDDSKLIDKFIDGYIPILKKHLNQLF